MSGEGIARGISTTDLNKNKRIQRITFQTKVVSHLNAHIVRVAPSATLCIQNMKPRFQGRRGGKRGHSPCLRDLL